MSDEDSDHAAASGMSIRCDRLPLPGGDGGGSSFISCHEVRIAFLPSAITRRRIQLNQGADAEPFRSGRLHVLTRDAILETRLRSIADLHARFPDVFLDVNHGIAIAPHAITELMIVSNAKWIKSHVSGAEHGAFRRPVYAKVSRRGYRELRRVLLLPKLCSQRPK